MRQDDGADRSIDRRMSSRNSVSIASIVPPELTGRQLSRHPAHPSAECSPPWPVLIVLIILLPLSLSSSTGTTPGRITSAPCAACGGIIQVRLDGKMKTHAPRPIAVLGTENCLPTLVQYRHRSQILQQRPFRPK